MVTEQDVPALAAVGMLVVLVLVSAVGYLVNPPGTRRSRPGRWRWGGYTPTGGADRAPGEPPPLAARTTPAVPPTAEFYVPTGQPCSERMLREMTARLSADPTDAPLGAYSQANLTHVSHAVAEAYHGAGVGRWWTSWARSTPARRRTLESQVLEMWSGQDAEVED